MTRLRLHLVSSRLPGPPGLIARVYELARARRAARLVARAGDAPGASVAAFRTPILARVGHGLVRVARTARPVFHGLIAAIWALTRELEGAVEELMRAKDARGEVNSGPPPAAGIAASIAAEVLGMAAAFGLVADLPMPIAILAAFGLALVTSALAAAHGVAWRALALDSHDHRVFALTPRVRQAWEVARVATGIALVAITLVYAVTRGQGMLGSTITWTAIGAASAVLGALFGAALYSYLPELRVNTATRRCNQLARRLAAACSAFGAFSDRALACGQEHVAYGVSVDATAIQALVREHYFAHPGKAAPEHGALRGPTSAQLSEMLLVPLPPELAERLRALDPPIEIGHSTPASLTERDDDAGGGVAQWPRTPQLPSAK